MNSLSSFPRSFASPAGLTDRAQLRTTRLLIGVKTSPGFVMGNRAFMRAWAARRAQAATPAAQVLPYEDKGEQLETPRPNPTASSAASQ